jgi:hypothetical protein
VHGDGKGEKYKKEMVDFDSREEAGFHSEEKMHFRWPESLEVTTRLYFSLVIPTQAWSFQQRS